MGSFTPIHPARLGPANDSGIITSMLVSKDDISEVSKMAFIVPRILSH